jgi:hypothetical protein
MHSVSQFQAEDVEALPLVDHDEWQPKGDAQISAARHVSPAGCRGESRSEATRAHRCP